MLISSMKPMKVHNLHGQNHNHKIPEIFFMYFPHVSFDVCFLSKALLAETI